MNEEKYNIKRLPAQWRGKFMKDIKNFFEAPVGSTEREELQKEILKY